MSSPSHALMLVGPPGSGKNSLAHQLMATILGVEDLQNYPYKMVITPAEGKAIGIEAARELEHFLSLKVPRAGSYNRSVIVEDAHLLTQEAQNALLKTLEEPPTGTLMILNVNHTQALLPTVRSRTQVIYVKKPEQARVMAFFQGNYDEKQLTQAYAISGGLPGLMHALLDQEDHPLLQATKQARQLLAASAFERLIIIDALSRDRTLALNTAFILQQMAHVSLLNAEDQASKKWQAVLTASFEAIEDLNNNAQPKLVLTNLVLSF